MDVTLTEEEVEIDVFVLDWYRRELLHEITRTDTGELREYLRHRDSVIEGLLSKLRQPVAAV